MLKLRQNLRDAFTMALEEMENVEGSAIVTKTKEELELLKQEDIIKDLEIQQDIQCIEELTEDINALQEQLGENDKKLTDPDIIVTAVDVEISEECYKGMAFKHGFRDVNAIRFSSESVLDSVKAEPRRYLAMSNEGIKDFIIKIWEKIKAFFRKIGEKLGIVKKSKEAQVKEAINKMEKAFEKFSSMSEEELRKTVSIELKKAEGELGKLKSSNESVDEFKLKKLMSTYPLVSMVLLSGDKGVIDELTDTNRAVGILKNYINVINKLKSAVKAKASENEMFNIVKDIGDDIYFKLGKWLAAHSDLVVPEDANVADKFKSVLASGAVLSFTGHKNVVITKLELDGIETMKFYASPKLKDNDYVSLLDSSFKLNGHQCKEISAKIKKMQVNNIANVTTETQKLMASFEKDMDTMKDVEQHAVDTLKMCATVVNKILLPSVNSVWTTNVIVSDIIDGYADLLKN